MRKLAVIMAVIAVMIGVVPAFADSFNETLRKALNGNADAQNKLGVMYEERGNYTEAAKWYAKAAVQGHALAQMSLGVAYENGQGVEQDYYAAALLYAAAADQGLETAKVLLDLLTYRLGLDLNEHGGQNNASSYGGGSSQNSSPIRSGSGKKTCYKCLGDKVERCPRCQGRGGSMQGGGYSHGKKVKEFWVKCRTCWGNGTVECSVCKGTGVY